MAVVEAVTEAIDSQAVTHADLRQFAELIAEAIRETTPRDQLAAQVEQATPKFVAVNDVGWAPGGSNPEPAD
jgi:hypothetical protein